MQLSVFHICLLSFAWFLTGSNTPVFSQEPATHYFSNLTTRDGLPSNIIAAITQDNHDFIWIGTGSGLARFDGYHFRIFKRTESPNSIPSNELSTLLVQDDWLWVGTWQGLCKINTTTFEVVRVDLGRSESIRALHKGSSGILWIGTGNGLFRYNLSTQSFKSYTNQNASLSHNTVRTIYEDSSGTLWVGTYDGLNRFDPASDRFTPVPLSRPGSEQAKNHLILDIVRKDNQALWIGTETGLYSLNTMSGASAQIKPVNGSFSNDVIKCIYTNSGEKLWLGTDFGLNVLNPGTLKNEALFHDPQLPFTIPNNVIWQIFEGP